MSAAVRSAWLAWACLLVPTAGARAALPEYADVSVSAGCDGCGFGWNVSAREDIDGDGVADVVAGAPGEGGESGAAYYVRGGTREPVAVRVLAGSDPDGYMGMFLDSLGDVNGDGFGEVLVGEPWFDAGESEGAAYLLWGTAAGPDGSAPFVWRGDEVSVGIGAYLSALGDADDDGLADFVLTARTATTTEVYLYRGAAGGPGSEADVHFSGESGLSGIGFARGRDLTGDGFDDMVVAYSSYEGSDGTGEVRVHLGSAAFLSATEDVVIPGIEAYRHTTFGWSLSTSGDVNGDGLPDLLVGAPVDRDVDGAVYLYLSTATGPEATPAATLYAPEESEAERAHYGGAVSGGGDLDLDGYADFAVGADHYDDTGYEERGAVYVYFGSAGAIPSAPTQTLVGPSPAGALGSSVSLESDADGDGVDDLLVAGAPLGDGWISYWFGTAVDADGDGHGANVDCDDGDAAIFPGAPERCDGVDEDCDGAVDDHALEGTPWYADADGDGYGDPEATISACDVPKAYVSDATDCDDANAAVHPGAGELCAAGDEDCDGLEGEDDPDLSDAGTWHADGDGDGYGDPGATYLACAEGVVDATDCDDADAAVSPGAAETCGNGVDDDCDEATADACAEKEEPAPDCGCAAPASPFGLGALVGFVVAARLRLRGAAGARTSR